MQQLVVLAAVSCLLTDASLGKTCNVSDYGAVGDNITDNTIAIQSAVDDCRQVSNTSSLRNKVLLPTQYKYASSSMETVYISGSLFLTSNLNFFIDSNVRLLGTSNKSNSSYPQIYTRAAGTMQFQHAGLLNAGICQKLNYNASAIGDQCNSWLKLENLTITGNGVIDGNGGSGWYESNLLTNDRPCLLNLMWVTDLEISNLTLTNSPFWTLHPMFSTNVLVEHLKIRTTGPNTDGVDPDSCSNVMIRNCDISTGDDCIAIKSGKDADGRLVGIPSDNITVADCVFGQGHGLTIGSEMSGNVTNVVFRNLSSNGTEYGPKIKSCVGRGGKVENVTYQDIVLHHVGTGISLSEYYSGCSTQDSENLPIVKGIVFENVTGTSTGSAGLFDCLQDMPCTEIQLRHVSISASKNGFSCEYAYGDATDVSPDACLKQS